MGAAFPVYAKGFARTSLRTLVSNQATAGFAAGGSLGDPCAYLSVADCNSRDFRYTFCGERELSKVLLREPGSACLSTCQAQVPDEAMCMDDEWLGSICGQYEASLFVIEETVECKPPTGSQYPCEHPSTCVNLLRGFIATSVELTGSMVPSHSLSEVLNPPTVLGPQGATNFAFGTTQIVKTRDYVPAQMRMSGLSTSMQGLYMADATELSVLDNSSAQSRIAMLRAAWDTNGEAANSCYEYAWELFYSIGQYEDAAAREGFDYRGIFDVAYGPQGLASSIGTRGVAGLPQIQKDGSAAPKQLEIGQGSTWINSYYFAPFAGAQERNKALQKIAMTNQRPFTGKVVIVDEALNTKIQSNLMSARVHKDWQWHLDQSNTLGPSYLDEQLYAYDDIQLEFKRLLYERAKWMSTIALLLGEVFEQGLEAALPPEGELFDPTIFENDPSLFADPITASLDGQIALRAERRQQTGGFVSTAQVLQTVTIPPGVDFELPTTQTFSSPLSGGTLGSQSGVAAHVALGAARRLGSMARPAAAASIYPVKPVPGCLLGGNLSSTLACLMNLVASLDAKIEAELMEADALGCLETAPGNPCSWSPRSFVQMLVDLGRFREPYYKQCLRYVPNNRQGFSYLANVPVTNFQYPPDNAVSVVNGQSCNRAAYNTDPDSIQFYFQCVDQHREDLLRGLMELLGKGGVIFGPPPESAVSIGTSGSEAFEVGNDNFTARGGFEGSWRLFTNGVEPSNPNWCALKPFVHGELYAGGSALFADFDLVDASLTLSGDPSVDSMAYLEIANEELIDTGPQSFSTNQFNIIEDSEERDETFFEAGTTFVVVVVPVSIKGGVSGRVGASVGLVVGTEPGESCADAVAQASFTPFVSVDGFASASIDALIVEAGVKITLSLIRIDLPFDVGLRFKPQSNGGLVDAVMSASARLDLVASILSGRFSAFVEICYLVACEEFEETIFKWDGPSYEENLFQLSFELPMLPVVNL